MYDFLVQLYVMYIFIDVNTVCFLVFAVNINS